MHAAYVLDDCSAAMNAILVLDACSAAMHAILVFDIALSAKLCDPCTLGLAYALQPLRLETSFANFLKHWHASPVDFSAFPTLYTTYLSIRTKIACSNSMLK